MKTKILVENMQCTRCVSSIHDSLLKVNGVYGIHADVANETLLIDHTEDTNLKEIESALDKIGYPKKSNADEFSAKAEEWDSNPRRVNQATIFFKKIVEAIPLNGGETLMDFGCGTGLVGLNFAPYVDKLVMVDKSPAMLSVLQKKISNLNLDVSKVELFTGDIHNYSKTDISIVVSLMTFHHLDDIDKTITDLYTKLLPGGYIAIGDLAKEDGSFHNEDVPHKGFEQLQLCEQLNKAGFELVLCEIFNAMKKETASGEKEFEQFLIIAKK